jgi:hypothetical protein
MRKLKVKKRWEVRQSYNNPQHVARILRVLRSHGYTATKAQARTLWLLCSSKVGATWLTMPDDEEVVWEHIAEFINEDQRVKSAIYETRNDNAHAFERRLRGQGG